jgi:hypothetical protein
MELTEIVYDNMRIKIEANREKILWNRHLIKDLDKMVAKMQYQKKYSEPL